MRRLDRHVPLHVGGLDRVKPGDPYKEFFGTHGTKAGAFDAKVRRGKHFEGNTSTLVA